MKKILFVQIRETGIYGGIESFADSLFFEMKKCCGYGFDYLYLGEKACPYEAVISKMGG